MRSLALVLVLTIGFVLTPRPVAAGTMALFPAWTANPSDAVRVGLWMTRAVFDGLDAISDLLRGYWESARRHNPPPRPPLLAPVPIAAAGPPLMPAQAAPGRPTTPARASAPPVSCNAPEQEAAGPAAGGER